MVHTDEPAVTNGTNYHLPVFFKFGTWGIIMPTLRSNANFLSSFTGIVSVGHGLGRVTAG